MCKIASEKKKTNKYIKWKKKYNCAKRKKKKKKHVILNKILICSNTEHSKAERNKIISIIIMESQLDKKNFFFQIFGLTV